MEFDWLRTKCKCGCGDLQVRCKRCKYVSGLRHRFNHVCITDVKVLNKKDDGLPPTDKSVGIKKIKEDVG